MRLCVTPRVFESPHFGYPVHRGAQNIDFAEYGYYHKRVHRLSERLKMCHADLLVDFLILLLILNLQKNALYERYH